MVMRKTGRLFAAALLLVAGLVGCDSKTDKESLQGNWVLTGMSAGGKTMPVNDGQSVVFSFSGDKLTTQETGKPAEESSFKIDPNQSPKHINLAKGKDMDDGIYALEGDTLKIAFNFQAGGPGKASPRPTSFEDKGVMTLNFKREKK